MKMQTIISAKGQVVLPKAVRNRLKWEPGRTLEIIALADGVTLRPISGRRHLPADEVFAEMGSIHPNLGPPVTDEEMHRLVVAEATKQYDFDR